MRPGNAGANTAADQIEVAESALGQIPEEHVEGIDILLRVDSVGATHELLAWCRAGRIRCSVGFDLTQPVRAAILGLREGSWLPALGSRWIVRRERPHPGAQLSFTDHDGHRFQVLQPVASSWLATAAIPMLANRSRALS